MGWYVWKKGPRALPVFTHKPNTCNTHTSYHRQATGVEYSSRLMSLTQEQFKALPPITFVLDGGVEVCGWCFCIYVCVFLFVDRMGGCITLHMR